MWGLWPLLHTCEQIPTKFLFCVSSSSSGQSHVVFENCMYIQPPIRKAPMFIVYIAMRFRFQIQIIVIIDLFSNIYRCSVNSSVMKKQKCPHCESVLFVSPLNSSHCYNQSTWSWIWPACSLKVAQIIASKAVTSSVKGTKALWNEHHPALC